MAGIETFGGRARGCVAVEPSRRRTRVNAVADVLKMTNYNADSVIVVKRTFAIFLPNFKLLGDNIFVFEIRAGVAS
jgi:hypothetical protein